MEKVQEEEKRQQEEAKKARDYEREMQRKVGDVKLDTLHIKRGAECSFKEDLIINHSNITL